MAPRLSRTSSILRAFCIAVWLAVIVTCIATYLMYPDEFTAPNIVAFLLRFQNEIWLVYLLMSALRGFTLLPSTPLVLAGTLLFPGQSLSVLMVSMTGILLSSSMIYFFSDLLGFSDFFERRKPEMIQRIKARLEHPLGIAFVAAWAFFPLVPTDLVCYAAGTTRMNFLKFIAAVFIGELILCLLYVYSGKYLFGTIG